MSDERRVILIAPELGREPTAADVDVAYQEALEVRRRWRESIGMTTLSSPRDYVEAAKKASRWVRRVGEIQGGQTGDAAFEVRVPVAGPFGMKLSGLVKERIERALRVNAPVNVRIHVADMPVNQHHSGVPS